MSTRYTTGNYNKKTNTTQMMTFQKRLWLRYPISTIPLGWGGDFPSGSPQSHNTYFSRRQLVPDIYNKPWPKAVNHLPW